MKSLKKVLALTLVVVMVFSMVACGGGGSEDEEVKTYICATECTYPPFDTVDENGNPIGIDMDIMNAIAEDQGFKVEFVDMPFNSIVPAIQSGTADILTAGISVTPERQEQVYFTTPYYIGGEAILVAKDNTDITCFDDFTSEHSVASQISNSYADKLIALEEAGELGKAVIMDGYDTCLLQLINGDIDAIFAASAVMRYYYTLHSDDVKVAGPDEGYVEIAFAVQNGNEELHQMIEDGLASIKADGTYDEIMTKWLGEGHGQE